MSDSLVLDLSLSNKSCPKHPHLLAVWKVKGGTNGTCHNCGLETLGLKPKTPTANENQNQFIEVQVETVVGSQTWKVKPSIIEKPCVLYGGHVPLAAKVVSLLGNPKVPLNFVRKEHDLKTMYILEDSTSITGNTTIARCLTRSLSLNLLHEGNAVVASQIDNFIDFAIFLAEQKRLELLDEFEQTLQTNKTKYLVGNEITLADLVLWEAIKLWKINVSGKQQLKSWLTNLEQQSPVQQAANFFGIKS